MAKGALTRIYRVHVSHSSRWGLRRLPSPVAFRSAVARQRKGSLRPSALALPLTRLRYKLHTAQALSEASPQQQQQEKHDMSTRNQTQQQQPKAKPASASSKASDGREQERPLNNYELRLEAKRERLLDRAERKRESFQQLHDRAHKLADAIPFGQPILVGHYSEGRDRRYRAKIHDVFGKAFGELDKAKNLESRATAVGTGGISSDDPDAIDKLREQLADVEESQARMKEANAAIRKGKTDDDKVANLVGIGFPELEARELVKPDFCGRSGFPSYALSNNNANGRRIKQRIEQLEQVQSSVSVEVKGNGYEYRECTDENRVMFVFPGKPDADTRAVLKRNAFKWSPSRGAWVRQLNDAGKWAGQRIREYLDNLTG